VLGRRARWILGCAAAIAAVLAAFVLLAERSSPVLRPLYRYDASHNILPDWFWNGDLPLSSQYRCLYTHSESAATVGGTTMQPTSATTLGKASTGLPVNTSLPTITGAAKVAQTLTASPGTWTGSPTYTYYWRRCKTCGNACATITGNTRRYLILRADVGSTLRMQVFATNAAGTSNVNSVPTAVVQP
jgi:hypothetical protein